MVGKWIETAATAALVAGCLAIIGCAAARQRRRPAPVSGPSARVRLVRAPAPRMAEALVVPFGAPRHDWPGGEVTSLHTPSALRRVVDKFAKDGRPVPLLPEEGGAPLGLAVALRLEGDGLHARFALAEGADLAGRFLAPSLQEEVSEDHPATAVPIRLAKVLATRRPSLPAPAETNQ